MEQRLLRVTLAVGLPDHTWREDDVFLPDPGNTPDSRWLELQAAEKWAEVQWALGHRTANCAFITVIAWSRTDREPR